MSSGNAASKTDSACPNFIAPPLSCPSTAKSCSAVRRCSSSVTSSADRPPSRLPSPSVARPATPSGSEASRAVRLTARRGMSVTPPFSLLRTVAAERGPVTPPPRSRSAGARGQLGAAAANRAGPSSRLAPVAGGGAAVEVGEGLQGRHAGGHRRQHHVARLLPPAAHAGQLGGHHRPGRVPVRPVQVGAPQAAGRAGQHQRADDAGCLPDADHQVRHAAAEQEAVQRDVDRAQGRQHHQVRPAARCRRPACTSGATRRSASAAAPDRVRSTSAAGKPAGATSPGRTGPRSATCTRPTPAAASRLAALTPPGRPRARRPPPRAAAAAPPAACGWPQQRQRGEVGAERPAAPRRRKRGPRPPSPDRRRLGRPGGRPAADLGQHAGAAQVGQQPDQRAGVDAVSAGRRRHLGLGPAAVQPQQHAGGRLVDPLDHHGALRVQPELQLAVRPPHRPQRARQQRPDGTAASGAARARTPLRGGCGTRARWRASGSAVTALSPGFSAGCGACHRGPTGPPRLRPQPPRRPQLGRGP